MNYLEYLRQPHYLAAVCAVVSAILVFAEGKFSKQKYEFKYYLKVAVIVFVNVYVVLQLLKSNYIQVDGITLGQKGGSLNTGDVGLTNPSSINPSNYVNVDTGNPNF
jgi:predicted neutral ceramidase superfamily lipid hydrolase